MSTATKKEFTMEQVFAMWAAKSKDGKKYFTGKYGEKQLRAFYNTKKQNPKEPDIRIYELDDDKKLSKEALISLWCNVSKNGKKYLSGKIDGKRVIGFINAKATDENKMPYFTIYWSEDDQKQEAPAKESKPAKKTTKKAEAEETDDLPF